MFVCPILDFVVHLQPFQIFAFLLLFIEAMAFLGKMHLPLVKEEEKEEEEWKEKLKEIVEAPKEKKIKGGFTTRAFNDYLTSWSGKRLVEVYAKCFHLAKNLSGKPQTDKFKKLKEVVGERVELQEAIENGLVPAPLDLGELVESERQAKKYQTRKRKDEEEKKRKRDEEEEKNERKKEELKEREETLEEDKEKFEEKKKRWEEQKKERRRRSEA